MKYKFLLVFILLFTQFPSVSAQDKAEVMRNEYKKLEVYFVTWDTLTRAALTIDEVKRTCDVHMSVFDPFTVEDIAKIIRSHSFKVNDGGLYHDARLVLEFTREDGESEIYYASNDKLFTGDSKEISELDEHLLDELNVFTQNRLWITK